MRVGSGGAPLAAGATKSAQTATQASALLQIVRVWLTGVVRDRGSVVQDHAPAAVDQLEEVGGLQRDQHVVAVPDVLVCDHEGQAAAHLEVHVAQAEAN